MSFTNIPFLSEWGTNFPAGKNVNCGRLLNRSYPEDEKCEIILPAILVYNRF